MCTRNRTVFILILTTVLLQYSGCRNDADISNQDDYIHRVKGIVLESRQITPQIHSFGSLSYETKADLTAIVEGYIEQKIVEEGDLVEKGDELIQLRNIQLDIQEQKAIAALENAKTEYELALSNLLDFELKLKARFIEVEKNALELEQQKMELALQEREFADKQKLYDAGGITRQALERLEQNLQAARTGYTIAQKSREVLLIGLRDEDLTAHGYPVPADEEERKKLLIELNSKTVRAQAAVAESRVFTAEQELSSIRQLIEELEISTPMNGIVGATYLEEGERAKEGDKLATIFNTDKVYVIFPVQETDIGKIQEGQKAFVQIDAIGEDTIEGIIDHISPMIDPQSGNLTVKALLNNPHGSMRPGMFARVDILFDRPRQVIQVPESAIIKKEGATGTTFAVVNDRIVKKEILLGEQHEGGYHVETGLEQGEIIIDSPSPVLKEGDRVEIYE